MIEYKHKCRLLFKAIAIVSICLFLVNDIVWAQPTSYSSPNSTLAIQSIFNPIINAVGIQHQKQVELELSGIIAMALRGLKRDSGNPNAYRSFLNINSALDKRCSNPRHAGKGFVERTLEVVGVPNILDNDPEKSIIIHIKTTGAAKAKKCFKVILKGDKLEDMLNASNVEIVEEQTTSSAEMPRLPASATVSPLNITFTNFAIEQYIESTASLLLQQNSNIILEKNAHLKQWCFRKSSMRLAIPQDICDALGKLLESEGQKALLISLRKHGLDNIKEALKKALFGKAKIEQAFISMGIPCKYNFKKILLVAPYGDLYGKPLKKMQVHQGTEKLAYILNRETTDADVRVYNPNLTSKESLLDFIRTEGAFDVIGFSVLQTVLKASLEMLCNVRKEFPDSMIIVGGNEMEKFPDEFFKAVPLDLAVIGDGRNLIDVIKMLNPDIKVKAILAFLNIPNLVILKKQNGEIEVIRTKIIPLALDSAEYPNYLEDAPFYEDDLTHNKHYITNVQSKRLDPIFCDNIVKKDLACCAI